MAISTARLVYARGQGYYPYSIAPYELPATYFLITKCNPGYLLFNNKLYTRWQVVFMNSQFIIGKFARRINPFFLFDVNNRP